ncbi:MAG: DsbA family protein [Gammaproteobacteria bacterium]|nr:DsbA family protein [Gammaproteobacteria bacterium]
MSKAKRIEQAKAKAHRQHNRRIAATTIGAVLLVAIVAAAVVYRDRAAESPGPGGDARQAALASSHSPTLGDAGAKVHIVEFLDPACETCALFFPLVKQWMNEAPDKLRLSVRHVAFHQGSDYALRILEASRNQDKYWQTLEALLASQRQWVQNHTVQRDRIVPAIAGVGLNMDQLMADMNGMEVLRRIEQDKNDAIVLKVSATPEYFVNGRPLPSFGQQQLTSLVREELDKNY